MTAVKRVVSLIVLLLIVVYIGVGTGLAIRPKFDTATPVTVATPSTVVPEPIPAPTTVPVVVPNTIPVSVRQPSNNTRLDSLVATLPPVLFAGGAQVHFGYNPRDTCCHAGGYNPEPNDVWVSELAFASPARLTYTITHELAHSVHLHSTYADALTAAVAGAPVVRPGSPWDVSEKVADCVAWVLFPAETAASGITYWNCPDPWRSQVRLALTP